MAKRKNEKHSVNKAKARKAEKELNKPAPNDLLTVLMINDLKGYHYMIQQIGKIEEGRRMFQYIVFDSEENKFYQTYITIHAQDVVGGVITMGDITKTVLVVKDMAEATIEELIRMKNPDYKGTEEEEKDREKGAVVVDVLEKANKPKRGRPKKAKK